MIGAPGAVPKLPTGISGFDSLAMGGLPTGRTTLVSGNTGAGKTLFAAEFLAHGIAQFDEHGVFVTFEERPADIRRNLASFGYDVEAWEAAGKWLFVDASSSPPDDEATVGSFDFGGLISRITGAVTQIGAERVSFDSLGAVFSRFDDPGIVRLELKRMSEALTDLHVTTVLTAERVREHETISRFHVEEFVTDNIVVLSNTLVLERRRRTLEVLKFRGAPHRTGEWLFTIDPQAGIVVLPTSLTTTTRRASDNRVSTGNAEIDRMCGGGFYSDSIALVSGPTGTGKTLVASHFAAAAVAAEERCLYISFLESREQLVRDAMSWGFDIEGMEASGHLVVVCEYPELASLEEHFLRIRHHIEHFQPRRLVVDNLSALERVALDMGMRDLVMGIGSAAKARDITTMFTATSPEFGSSPTETHVSALTDIIILLRYVDVAGDVHRCLSVRKMRGSYHDSTVRQFVIDDRGMHVGERVPDPSAHTSADVSGRSFERPSQLHRVGHDQGNG